MSLLSATESPLFVSIQTTGKQVLILLFDVSGSVINQSKDGKKVIEIMVTTIFQRLRTMGIKYFKCIFFGSMNRNKMINGYIIDESIFTVHDERGFLEIATSHADLYNLTCPHFAIDKIPKEWLTTKSQDTVVKLLMVGDGEVYDGSADKREIKRQTSISLTRLLDENPLIQFGIHTVDVVHPFGAENMAGMDIYDILKDNKLTNRITEFVLHTSLEDGRELFSNKIVPPGFIGFRSQMFNLAREDEFFAFISNEITNCHDETIYDTVRHCSTTVASIIKARGLCSNLSNNLMYSYANLFKMFEPEPTVDIICEDLISSFIKSVKNTLGNQSELSTSFTTDRKKFFEEANGFLSKSVKEAIGTSSIMGYSFPLNNIIYSVTMASVISGISREMPYSCYTDEHGISTPILPETRRIGKMTNQCMRQYVRACMVKLHGFKVQSEQSKFGPLVYMTMAYFSDIPISIKRMYVDMSICMLQKTLTGIDITELEHLRKGNTHSSKNWVNELQEVVNLLSGTTISAKVVWFVICNILNEQLGDTILSQNQYIHVKHDVPNPEKWMELCSTFSKLKYEEIKTDNHEYICPFTHENTSSGGFSILSHPWNKPTSTTQCSPNMVILNDPDLMGMLVVNDHFNCPVCRAKLHRNKLEFVQKCEVTSSLPSVQLKYTCGVVILKGPIGCGKTTMTKKLVELLTPRGKVHVVSNDTHCVRLIKSGVNPKAVSGQASKLVTDELSKFIAQPGSKFVIVDICNERHKDGSVFNVSMPTTIWTYSTIYVNINPDTTPLPMFNNYFAWCLLHVLARTESGMGDYWLNPESAGFHVCKKVLSDKVNALFPGKYNLPQVNTTEEAIEKLTSMSTAYDEYLKSNYNQMTEIDKCLAKFV
jgi:hypothetical protein